MRKLQKAAAIGLTLVCVATGVAATAGGQGDPLITLSYVNETILPNIRKETEAYAQEQKNQLAMEFGKLLESQGGQQSGQTQSSSYTVVTLSKGQKLHLELGSEVLLRVGSATAGAKENPALVDMTTGENLNNGGTLVQNHLYLSTMTEHYVTAGSDTVKVLVRGGYTIG